jgi:hypothetical protein
VSISAPFLIGACDNLTIDLTSSSGSGGRIWNNVTIDVRSTDPNASRIDDFLQTEYIISPPTSIPRDLLKTGYGYTFIATLCNFLGSCSSSSQRVVASSDVVPIVSFIGTDRITIHKKDSLELSVDAFTSTCDGSLSRASMEYFWTFFSTEGMMVGNQYKSKSVNPKKFILKPDTH